MKKIIKLLLITSLLINCAALPNKEEKEQRAHINKMAKESLTELYDKHPRAKDEIKRSAGYAVFSNIHTNIIFATTNGGYGVAVNSKTKKRTYMEMFGLGLGIGLGVKATHMILIFHKDHEFKKFLDNGWEFGIEASATVLLDHTGGELSGSSVVDDISVYNLTSSGVALEASLEGTKFWVDDHLNH
jgi:lipid-binding SYLF domain-containing protein